MNAKTPNKAKGAPKGAPANLPLVQVRWIDDASNEGRWSQWSIGGWCPLLGAVPHLEGMSEADPEGLAANLIWRARQDFFGVGTPISAANVRETNRVPCLDDYCFDQLDDSRLAQARWIYQDARRIEKEALWTFERNRNSRGENNWLRIGHALSEAASGLYAMDTETIDQLLTNATARSFDFAANYFEVHQIQPPFSTPKKSDWRLFEVVAIFAIHDAAAALHDMLAGHSDQTQEDRLRDLMHAQLLDKIAREYKAADEARERSDLAQAGASWRKQQREAGFRRAEEVQEQRLPIWDAWKKRATELRASNPGLGKRRIAAMIEAETGESAETIRKHI